MTGGLLLDLALVLILVAYGISGYRHGLVSSVFSLLGFFAGALIAVWILPTTLADLDAVADDPRLRVLVLIVGVVGIGWIGQVLGSLLGAQIRRRMGQQGVRRTDSVLGAIVVVLAASLMIWFLGGSLRTAGNPAVAKAMAESRVLRSIDAVVPDEAGQVFAGFRGFLSSQGFPQVFGDLVPEPITPVEAPDPGISDVGAITRAATSVVKVTTTSDTCGRGQEGTGWVLSPERVVTNAHVVAGADLVRIRSQEEEVTGRVVIFDPDRDLAVIEADGLDAPALELGADLTRGTAAAIPGYPLDGPYTVVPARVRQVLDARGRDIYGDDPVVREIYSLYTRVQPGNSGGPLLDASGRVAGVVFAKSLEDDDTGYALTLDEAMPVLDAARGADREVDTGACLPG
ncbi:MarP family serine protease [Intrasporangium sp.]|uniref:MarP family serine protease n=1 Tax=Intrasporangium sp. TaxID=1925024 RepID=UPI00293A5A50|nr:MarP family serine protease [Intrasporangium sp.]MDV3222036.1 MarP family serine protease [Intrasporangium sp.]